MFLSNTLQEPSHNIIVDLVGKMENYVPISRLPTGQQSKPIRRTNRTIKIYVTFREFVAVTRKARFRDNRL